VENIDKEENNEVNNEGKSLKETKEKNILNREF